MDYKETYIKTIEGLREHLKGGRPTIFLGSRTSTVIPFDHPADYLNLSGDYLEVVHLVELPKNLELLENGDLLVEGPVNWKEAREFCQSNSREILTGPTEELACILSGLATSATGERCFGFGTLREQVRKLEYLDHKGNIKELTSERSLLDLFDQEEKKVLEDYQQDYQHYSSFKNAPFPRMDKETDLMIGTEGQLGVVTKAVIKTRALEEKMFLFFLLPKWEVDYEPHLEIFELVQSFRSKIYSCELLDSNSLSVLDEDQRPGNGSEDLIFVELGSSNMEEVLDQFVSQLKLVSQDKIFQIEEAKCHELRMAVPRMTFEKNAQMGVTKKGTDVQVHFEKFKNLLNFYRELAQLDVPYNLFGHFGDAHLHFNYLPTSDQLEKCDQGFTELYKNVKDWEGSPFAEHGVGVIKKKFIKHFYGENQIELFKILKNKFDPKNQFFPIGFMGGFLD